MRPISSSARPIAGWLLAALVFFVAAACSATPSPTSVSGYLTPTATSTPLATATPVPPTPSPTSPALQPTVTVAFIDVGQGDAILIDYGATEVLIDGGASSSSPALLSYLRGRVDGPLEAVVATHPDADHIGGLAAVLEEFSVPNVWLNGEEKTTQAYQGFMSAVQNEQAITHTARRGDILSLGDLDFKVLSPVTLSGTTNENSVVVELDHGEMSFLFMGDAGVDAEASMLDSGLVHRVSVLKVGHHGSRYSSSPSFLGAAAPAVAVYMAGTGNSYGHPHPETISNLERIGATIYGTDKNGAVEVNCDGRVYSVSTAK